MSTNISKQKRDIIISKIKTLKEFILNSDGQNKQEMISYLSDVESGIDKKKYGLVFEEHEEEQDVILKNHLPILTEDNGLFVNENSNSNDCNFLLEGDNLASLKLLEKTHKGRIDVIYIDPPYNTGHEDFTYDDDYIEEEDSFRHSKWIKKH